MHPNIPSMGITFLEVFTANFLIHSGYSEQLSKNFRSILRGIGNSIAGDEKLLYFTGIRMYILCCFKFSNIITQVKVQTYVVF